MISEVHLILCALQPVSLDVVTDSLMVSALVNIRFNFHDPPQDTRIHTIVLSVKQTFSLRGPDGTFRRAGKPQKLNTLVFDDGRTPGERTADGGARVCRGCPLQTIESQHSQLCDIRPGEPRQFAALAQLPTDDWLRPTTIEGTDTPLGVSHELVAEVTYRSPKDPRHMRVLTCARPVDIASVSHHLHSQTARDARTDLVL